MPDPIPGAPALSNPIDLWRGLSPAIQERLGALAITAMLAIDEMRYLDHPTRHDHAFERTAEEANGEFLDLIVEHLPHAYDPAGEPLRPDLNTLGIRQCTACGCTERHGCTPPCTWATPTLCTACLPPAKEA